jgi:nucleotide-binding universal stress UspA family protein
MKVMVCTDGSECGDKAVQFAARLASNYRVDLTLLHVIEETTIHAELPDNVGFEPKKEEAKVILSRAKKLADEISNEVTCHEQIACGPVSSEIVRIAEVEGFDGIIVGTRGLRGLKRMLLGSVAVDVIQHAHCPVTVVR